MPTIEEQRNKAIAEQIRKMQEWNRRNVPIKHRYSKQKTEKPKTRNSFTNRRF